MRIHRMLLQLPSLLSIIDRSISDSSWARGWVGPTLGGVGGEGDRTIQKPKQKRQNVHPKVREKQPRNGEFLTPR